MVYELHARVETPFVDGIIIFLPDRCAMALVHSRVRRVVYGVRDPERGCLGSLMMLHTLPALNHNYRAFEGVCADDCRRSLLAVQDSKPAV